MVGPDIATRRGRGVADLILTTYDWVPEAPRGYVRDLRIRWALEEAGLAYAVRGVAFRERGAEHVARQPFGQVPWLTDGALSIFESGAILLHLGGRSDALLPADPVRRSEAISWLFAALNSVEMPAVPWTLYRFAGDEERTPGREMLDGFLRARLDRMEPVVADRRWLAGAFSIADIAMSDVLRLVDRFDGLAAHPSCRAYVARATGRAAFRKAHADQMAHFAAGDRA